MMSDPIIGIDLGTTYAGAAVFHNDWLRMVSSEDGTIIIPAMVGFTHQGGVIVGDDVRYQMANNAENTIYDAKRFIGQKFNEKWTKNIWPFKIVNLKGKVYFKVDNQRYLPEQISALILRKLKQTCEKNLGQEIKRAVISVPAYFNDSQRLATKNAGKIAGLKVMRIINEPTAAALAYGYGRGGGEFNENQTVLVFDLGGGTLDVSIVVVTSSDCLVRATTGDSNLGGQDITNNIRNLCIADFMKKHGIDIKKNGFAISRLTGACENAKKRLSNKSCSSTEIKILCLCKDKHNVTIDYSTTITRKQFESLNSELFDRTLHLVENCLLDAKLTTKDIDEVVLVGGSTRIPKLQQMLERFFTAEKVNKSLNPDEAVALGAAIQGAIMRGDAGPKLNKRVLFDVTPLSLGTDVEDNEMNIIIKKNTLIPVKKTERFWTLQNNQTSVHCGIYQGERSLIRDNFFLGEFNLVGLRKAPRGELKVDVTFDLNTNGILCVTAQEVNQDGSLGGNFESIDIENSVGRLSKADIQKMIQQARRWEATDAKLLRISRKRGNLNRYCYDVDQYLSLESTKAKLDASVYEKCIDKAESVRHSLSKQEYLEIEEYEVQLENLQDFFEPLIGQEFIADNDRFIGEHTPIVTSDLIVCIPGAQQSSKYDLD